MFKVSVIIPLYNKEDTIARAIDSVLKQTLQPYEILIINDGSTDNSEQKVKLFDDSRIKFFKQTNKGVSITRNNGIELANGNYIAFLDADDEWTPDFLFTINELIAIFPDAVGYGTSYYKKYSDNLLLRNKLTKTLFTTTYGLLNNYFEVCNHSDPPICTSAICIEKKYLLKIGGFPEGVKAGEDLLTWARLSLLGDFAYSTTPLAIYYQPAFSPIISTPDINDYVGREFKKMLEFIHSETEKKEFKRYIGNWHKMRAALFLITGKNRNSLSEIKQSIKYNKLTFKSLVYIFLIIFPIELRYKILFTK